MKSKLFDESEMLALLPEVALSVTGRTYAQEQHNFLEDSINMRQPRFLCLMCELQP